jgi:hypothetical protein
LIIRNLQYFQIGEFTAAIPIYPFVLSTGIPPYKRVKIKLHTDAYVNANACKEALDLMERYRVNDPQTLKTAVK